MSGLSPKQRVFVEAYLMTWNATEAARQAGYRHPNKQGPRLLVNVGLKDAIATRLQEKAMGTDEVLARLAEHARGDMGEFLDISSVAFQVDLSLAKENGLTKLIKKVKQRTTTTLSKDGVETETSDIEVELYDAQAALVHIGKHLGLFKERIDVTSGDERIGASGDEYARSLAALASALRGIVHPADVGPQGAVDAPKPAAVDGPAEPGG